MSGGQKSFIQMMLFVEMENCFHHFSTFCFLYFIFIFASYLDSIVIMPCIYVRLDYHMNKNHFRQRLQQCVRSDSCFILVYIFRSDFSARTAQTFICIVVRTQAIVKLKTTECFGIHFHVSSCLRNIRLSNKNDHKIIKEKR